MNPTERIRFSGKPSPKTPPQGQYDLHVDPDSGTLVCRDSNNRETLISGPTLENTGTVRYLRVNADNSYTELSAEQLLSDLTPTRILYVTDLAASWFNGSKNDLIGVIPLTAAQAVVGTKIRVRGTVKMTFQGTATTPGGDLQAIVFNVASDSSVQEHGVGYVVTGGAAAEFNIDLELELKNGGTGKYKVGLGSNTPTYLGSASLTGSSIQRWGDTGSSTGFVEDPTTPESVGSTAGLVVQLQTAGGTAKSICNVIIDLNYEYL